MTNDVRSYVYNGDLIFRRPLRFEEELKFGVQEVKSQVSYSYLRRQLSYSSSQASTASKSPIGSCMVKPKSSSSFFQKDHSSP